MNAHTHHTPHDDDTDGEFARRLRARHDAEAHDLPGGAGPEAAVSRAHARRRNRRAVLASAAAVAIIAGATSQTLSNDPGDVGLDTASQGAVVDDSLTFDWTVTDDGLSQANHHAVGETGLYALSTAPGTRMEDYPEGDAPRAMYRLADDGTWTPIPFEGDDPNVGAVSERAGTLYGLSTGAATGVDTARPAGSISTDGGQTWSTVPLQAATPPSDDVAWTVHYSLDIASTTDSTMAIVTGTIGLPYEDLFPELFTDGEGGDSGHETRFTDDGVALVRYSDHQPVEASGEPAARDDSSTTVPDGENGGEVVRTVTWDELGVSGADALGPQRWAYAAEGGEWNEISLPAGSESGPNQHARLDTVGNHLLLTVEQYDEETTVTPYVSADGQDWAVVDTPGPGELLPTSHGLVHVGYTQHGNTDALQVSRDLGSTWTPLDLRALDPALENMGDDQYVYGSAGPLGVALMVHLPTDEDEPVPALMLFSTDLDRWSVTDLDEVVPDGGYTGDVLVGTDRVVVLGHTNTGELGSPERSATLTGVPRRT